MRTTCVALRVALVGALALVAALPTQLAAQRAIAGGIPPAEVPVPQLTLRPTPEMRELAEEVAAVLELRSGEKVEVGEPPPPGLIEAVPFGHVALAAQNGAVVLVLGAVGGVSHDTVVKLGAEHGQVVEARAVALAVEALRDLATEMSRALEEAREEQALAAELAVPVAQATAPAASPEPSAPRVSVAPSSSPTPRDEGAGADRGGDSFFNEVELLAFVRAYSGASSASSAPRAGVGAGVGLCVLRHCLFVQSELPIWMGHHDPYDTRYEYTTFSSGFYTRPLRFGRFSPGASVGFVTRLGQFEQDMGLSDSGWQTDLGARGTLELGYEAAEGLDVIAETGADWTLDRFQLSGDGEVRKRGDRLSPWAQAVVRYRL